jgi:mono/diheme cytochrome c family protein
MERKEIMRRLMILGLFCVGSSLAAQAPVTAVKPSPAATHTVPHVNDGQRVFEQNCSRCHNPPDGFSPRISGTVVRHMRVRANLSEADMKAIMKFFHP